MEFWILATFSAAFFQTLRFILHKKLSLGGLGPTVNLPIATITHHWGRGSYRSGWLTLVNLQSAWLYFRKWGLKWW